MHTELYNILGVKTNATPEEIKNAYREKSKQYHPDMETGDEEMFIKVKEAYDILSDPTKRDVYDQTGETSFKDIQNGIRDLIINVIIPAIVAEQETSFERINMIYSINEIIGQIKMKLVEAKKNPIINCKKLEVFIKRTQKEGPDNVFMKLVKEKVIEYQKQIKAIEFQILVANETKKLVNEYKYNLKELIKQISTDHA